MPLLPLPHLLCCTELIVVIVHSPLLPFFLHLPTLFSLWLLLQDRVCPMRQFIKFHFTATIHSTWNMRETLSTNDPWTKKSAEFRGRLPVYASCGICSRSKVSQNTTHTSLNCCSAYFSLQWFSASILHTTIVIYGNYPSLGSSINWLLLGDGSSCCLVRGSFTVRGNAGEFNRRHL